jgi:diguanylate cyclase (GGDEF)-like protein
MNQKKTTKPTILIFHATPSKAQAIQNILTEHNFHWHLAHTKEQVKKLLLAKNFSLILIDVAPEDPSGSAVAQLVCEQIDTLPIPIIFLVTDLEFNFKVKGQQKNYIDYMQTATVPLLLPFKIKQLLAQTQIARQLNNMEEYNSKLLNAVKDGVIILNQHNQIIKANHSACKILQQDFNELIEQSYTKGLKLVNSDSAIDYHITQVRNSGCPVSFLVIIQNHESNEKNKNIEVNIILLTPNNPTQPNLLITLHNLSHTHISNELRFDATHDVLTKLPNRKLLMDRIQQAISYSNRHSLIFSIFFIDLDGFKKLNDTHGHEAGDIMLTMVSERLLKIIRDSDTLSRIGGDEFVILLNNIQVPDNASTIANKILESLKKPFEIQGLTQNITVSIGIALYPEDGTEPESLLRHADAAMYHAKDQGKNNYQFYEQALQKKSETTLKISNDLKKAIKDDDFVLYFQPQHHIDATYPVGVEVLIHWKHHQLGLLTSSEFISLAENFGIIESIDRWVFTKSCEYYKQWQTKQSSTLRLYINLSSKQFASEGLAKELNTIVEHFKIPAENIYLEISENIFIGDHWDIFTIMHQLKNYGFKLVLDNFGTGYSSLKHLRELPIDVIKIDRTFIRYLVEDERDSAIVKNIINLASNLKTEFIVVGVETQAQVKLLKQLGCLIFQGDYYSKPLDHQQLEAYFEHYL